MPNRRGRGATQATTGATRTPQALERRERRARRRCSVAAALSLIRRRRCARLRVSGYLLGRLQQSPRPPHIHGAMLEPSSSNDALLVGGAVLPQLWEGCEGRFPRPSENQSCTSPFPGEKVVVVDMDASGCGTRARGSGKGRDGARKDGGMMRLRRSQAEKSSAPARVGSLEGVPCRQFPPLHDGFLGAHLRLRQPGGVAKPRFAPRPEMRSSLMSRWRLSGGVSLGRAHLIGNFRVGVADDVQEINRFLDMELRNMISNTALYSKGRREARCRHRRDGHQLSLLGSSSSRPPQLESAPRS